MRHPDPPRQFKTPLVPLVPILGIVVCGAMIFGLGWPNWVRLLFARSTICRATGALSAS